MAAESLHLVVFRKNNYVTDMHVSADPDDHKALVGHLIRAIKRDGWGEQHYPDFSMKVHREFQRGVYKTITI